MNGINILEKIAERISEILEIVINNMIPEKIQIWLDNNNELIILIITTILLLIATITIITDTKQQNTR